MRSKEVSWKSWGHPPKAGWSWMVLVTWKIYHHISSRNGSNGWWFQGYLQWLGKPPYKFPRAMEPVAHMARTRAEWDSHIQWKQASDSRWKRKICSQTRLVLNVLSHFLAQLHPWSCHWTWHFHNFRMRNDGRRWTLAAPRQGRLQFLERLYLAHNNLGTPGQWRTVGVTLW